MMENWRDIPGYEGRYQVSDLGNVKSVAFKQRYLLRTGAEAWRLTKERLIARQITNSGYFIVHLYLDNKRKVHTIHTLVARAFIPNPQALPEVNHRDGRKSNCKVVNLEWESRTGNKLHAVAAGLNSQARQVTAPSGAAYPSIAQAARGEQVAHRTAAKWAAA